MRHFASRRARKGNVPPLSRGARKEPAPTISRGARKQPVPILSRGARKGLQFQHFQFLHLAEGQGKSQFQHLAEGQGNNQFQYLAEGQGESQFQQDKKACSRILPSWLFGVYLFSFAYKCPELGPVVQADVVRVEAPVEGMFSSLLLLVENI